MRNERWRVSAGGENGSDVLSITSATKQMRLDEMVLADWLHVERLSDGLWDVHVGEMHFTVSVNAAGEATRIVRHDGESTHA